MKPKYRCVICGQKKAVCRLLQCFPCLRKKEEGFVNFAFTYDDDDECILLENN